MSAFVSLQLRHAFRAARVRAAHASGKVRRAKQHIAGNQGIIVLALHRIVPDTSLASSASPRGMVLRENLFIQMLDYLESMTDVVSPAQLQAGPHGARSGNTRPRVLLTFDDGWADNTGVAAPHLNSRGLKACFFLSTALLGSHLPFWPEQAIRLLRAARDLQMLGPFQSSLLALSVEHKLGLPPPVSANRQEEPLLNWLKQLPPARISNWLTTVQQQVGVRTALDPWERLMTWESADELRQAGHLIGSHTRTHALLNTVQPASQREELTGSKQDILENLRQCQPLWLSYPNGSSNPDIRSLARSLNYKFAFGIRPGVWTSDSDQLDIPRLNIWDGTASDDRGRFCPATFEYSLYWRTARAL